MSDTHDEQSQNTDEETVETPFTEPHTTLIDSGTTKNVPSKPAQDTLMKKIGLMEQRINVLTEARDAGIAKDIWLYQCREDVHDEIKKLRKELEKEKRLLSVQKNFESKKTTLKKQSCCSTSSNWLWTAPLVESQLALLETISNIAIQCSASDERRRTERIRNCLNLSDLLRSCC
ncbi:hypothetical protein HHI36_021762 [Cryptolaemus montrouzieri]|uniref:Uncharacterized protein n=1 Tax=Cryptolaemus montrouzieri TaxID=559131 RepID=A0ABD2MYL5_9CUCU